MAESLQDECERKEDSDDKDDPQESKDIEKYFRVDLMYNKEGDKWPHTTYLHYTLKLSSQPKHSKDSEPKILSETVMSSAVEHAEITLLKNLEKELISFMVENQLLHSFKNVHLKNQDKDHTSSEKDKEMKMNLKIVMNYSSCATCADQIVQFKKKFEKNFEIDISLTFGTFYKIYPKDDGNKNIKGLAQLQNAGIQLRLCWDSNSLKKKIKKIGADKEREEREKKDREYMELVKKKAKEIAD